MICVLVDTNVVLDVLLDRRPHAEQSITLWGHIESGRMRGLLPAHAITTIHCLLRRELGETGTGKIVASLMSVFGIAPVNSDVLAEALSSSSGDFEDAIAAAAARQTRCQYIVTRDPRGFRGAAVKAVAPEIVNALFAAGRHN